MKITGSTPSRQYATVCRILKESRSVDLNRPLRSSLAEAHRARIAENHARILLEKLDDDDMKKSKAILDKLNSIAKAAKAAKMVSVETAIQAASKDLTEFLGGGIMAMVKRGISALAKKLGAEGIGENPLLKCATMLSALEDGFGKVSDIISMNLKDYDPKGKHKDVTPIQYAGENDKSALEKMTKTVIQAFVPGDFYSKLKSLFHSKTSIPYVDDARALASDILGSTPEQLGSVIEVVTASSIAADAVDTAKDLAKTSKGGEGSSSAPKKTSAPQTVKGTDDLAKVLAAGQAEEKKQDPGEALKAASENPKKVTQQFIDYVAKKSGQKSDVVDKVLSALIKAGKLKTDFKVTESRASHTSPLSISDVEEARALYLESGGSSRRWVDLLVEDALEKKDVVAAAKDLNLDRKGFEAALGDLAKGKGQLAQKLGVNSGNKPTMKRQNIQNLLKAFDESAAVKSPEGGESGDKKDLSDNDVKSLVKVIKDQKLDLKSLKGRSAAISTIKSQYGMDVKAAKQAYEEKVLPAFKSETEKGEDKGAAPKFLDKIKSGIASAKSSEDLIKLMSDEGEKKQGDNLKKLVKLLKKIFSDPRVVEKLLPQVPKAGGLQDKVKDLLSGGSEKGGDVEKHAKTIGAIKDSLEDVEPTAIASILEALPEYLMAEALRKRSLLESRRV